MFFKGCPTTDVPADGMRILVREEFPSSPRQRPLPRHETCFLDSRESIKSHNQGYEPLAFVVRARIQYILRS
jgi:hypothetical protein